MGIYSWGTHFIFSNVHWKALMTCSFLCLFCCGLQAPPTDLIRIPPLLSQSWQVQPLTVWDWRLLWQPWEQALGVAPRWWHSQGVASSRRAQTWWRPCAPPAPSCDPAGTGCSCSPVDTQHNRYRLLTCRHNRYRLRLLTCRHTTQQVQVKVANL